MASFMKNRLEVARELLREDGLIFISIDSSRQNANGVVGTSALPYLNVLMDEVFGRTNFIGHLHWKRKTTIILIKDCWCDGINLSIC